MIRRNWKTARPTSLLHAMELCKQYALVKHNMSEQRIAERMGLPNHWALYKWLASGRMPAVMIPAYEAACGCHYVTQWLAASAGKLAIDMPTGKACDATDIQELQVLLHATTGALLAFHAGQQDADHTLATIQCAMESLGWHHGNVAQHKTPQLDLGEHDDE
jgi:hypothetical protein